MPLPNDKLPWIDTLKGIGISLVVLGHTINTGVIRDFIYVFHMPLFFVLSGYLHRPNMNFKGYAERKAKHLLIPYVSFTVAATCLWLAHAVRHGITDHQIKEHLFIALWGGREMKGEYGVLWFLTCLFFTQQIMNWLICRFSSSKVSGLVLAAFSLSYMSATVYPNLSVPLDLDVVLAAMPFFYLGYRFKQCDLGDWRLLVFGLCGVGASVYLVSNHVPISFDMRDGEYGVPLVSSVLALGCISACMCLSKFLSRFALSAPLKHIGALSMGIMFIHKELPGIKGYALLEKTDLTLTFLVILGLSFALAHLASSFLFTRALLLGSERDLQLITQKLAAQNQSPVH